MIRPTAAPVEKPFSPAAPEIVASPAASEELMPIVEATTEPVVAPPASTTAVATPSQQPQQPPRQQGQQRQDRRQGSGRWREATYESSSVAPQQAPTNVRKIVLLNATEPGEVRVAILENGELAEIFMERKSQGQQAGNVYKARIVNVEPSLQAAFVDLGTERNGFLHASDCIPPDGGYGDILTKTPRGQPQQQKRGNDRPQGRPQDRPQPAAQEKPQVVSHEAPAAPAAVVPAVTPAVEMTAPPAAAQPAPAAASEIQSPPSSAAPVPPGTGNAPAAIAQQGDGQRHGKRRRRRRGGRGRSGRARTFGPAQMRSPAPQDSSQPQPAQPDPDAVPATVPAQSPAVPAEPVIPISQENSAQVASETTGSADTTPAPAPEPDAGAVTPPLAPPPPAVVVNEEPSAENEADDEAAGESDAPEPETSEELEGADQDEQSVESSSEREARQESEQSNEAGEAPDVDVGPGTAAEHDVEEPAAPSAAAAQGAFETTTENVVAAQPVAPLPAPGQPAPVIAPQAARPGGRSGRPHDRRYTIQEMLREGQEILVQVAKEGIGQKGPALTTYISMPGRYLVLMPAVQRLGVSKRIENEEQRRSLKEVLADLNPPEDMGVIVRTAGMGRAKEELQRDMNYLMSLWDTLKKKARMVKAPELIYQEGDVVTRVFRDVISDDVAEIIIDDPVVMERAREFLRVTAPDSEQKLKLHSDAEPLFHRYGVEQQIQRLFNRKVTLRNGGSIVIEQTEALVAIDVNTGRFREKRNQDDTILQTNLEAAREIARQLRLRDIGGLVMIDFIDMEIGEHRRRVERELKAHLARDKARINVLPISTLGVVEMTRQRVRHSLRKTLFERCPHCSGSGHIKSAESLGLEMLREMKNQLRDKGVRRIKVLLNSGLAFAILNQFRKDLVRMEEAHRVTVEVIGDPGVPVSQMQVSTAKEGGEWVLKKVSEVDDYVRNS